MSNGTPDITETDDIVTALAKYEELLVDPDKNAALREILRSGVSVEKAAAAIQLPVSVAWRMVTRDPETAAAINEGDELRRRRLRSSLENRADDMLNVIVSLAHDPDADDAVRLKAAQDILDRTGLLDKTDGKGGKVQQTATVVELSTIDPDFHERLNRITVKSATKG